MNRRQRERINISASVLTRKTKRLEGLKTRLNNVLEKRKNMSENWASTGSTAKYKSLNDQVAKLSFEIMLLEGGTIKEQHTADWINEKKWKYQNPYTGEVRDFKKGDRFNLDYGGKTDLDIKDWEGGKHNINVYNATLDNPQTFNIERLQDKIENLKIGPERFEAPTNDKFVFVKNGEIVEKAGIGTEKMLYSDYMRGTDDGMLEHQSDTLQWGNKLRDQLKLQNNESKSNHSVTSNGTL